MENGPSTASTSVASVTTTTTTPQAPSPSLLRGYNDTEPINYQKYSFHRSCRLQYEFKAKSVAVLRSMMIGGLNDEVNSFEDPPFSELSVSERQGFQLVRPVLVEEIVRRAYFLLYIDQKDAKIIFQCTRASFPKPSQWSLERCIEWLNSPIHQLATWEEFLWMRQEYDELRIHTANKVTLQRQSREAALAASRAAAHKLLGGNAALDDTGDDGSHCKRQKHNHGSNGSEDSTVLIQRLQTSQNALLEAVRKAVVDVSTHTTRLTQAMTWQATLATLQSRQATLTALLVARQTTRDRRVELQVANANFPQHLIDEAKADYEQTWQDLQKVETEIQTWQKQLESKLGGGTANLNDV